MLRNISKLLLTLILLIPGLLYAHDARPLSLQIRELGDPVSQQYRYTLRMQIPPSIEMDNKPFLVLPEVCQHERFGLIIQLSCSAPLTGQTIGIGYPKFNPSITTLIRVNLHSGETYQTLLSPSESSWKLPSAENATAIISEYTTLGIRHILAGWDHLLFLLCLLMISGTVKRTLITISGFTLAHSLTLILTTLKVISLPVAPVEAVIALSILFLATEVARGEKKSLAWRYPVAVSTAFGLIHGFGFASVLKEIGLPQTELTTALLFFNIGVEIGQVIFVLTVVSLFALLRSRSFIPFARVQQLLIYGCGSLAAFWALQRIASF